MSKMEVFPCTIMVFFLKERSFLNLTSLQTFYSFLKGSLLVIPLMVQQHVPFIVRGMLSDTKDRCQITIPPFES